MASEQITFVQRDAADELVQAHRRRQLAEGYMTDQHPSHDGEVRAVLGFLIADSVYEEKKAAALRAFAPLMP